MPSRISFFPRQMLIFGFILTVSPSVQADGIYITDHSTNTQVNRPLDGIIDAYFPIQLIMSSNFAFEGITVTALYNANGDKIDLVVPDWSWVDFPHGVFQTDLLFWARIDKDTPLGLYDSSSPTSHEPTLFTAHAWNPLTNDTSTASVSFSLEILATPLAVPEPSTALLFCLGSMALLGRRALRRAGRLS